MRMLTYNIQAAIGAVRTSDYIFKGHRQLLNVKAKNKTLKNIAGFIADFDIVCLQEIDLGGRRSGFKSQLDILKSLSGLEHCVEQTNRIIGRTSVHGNAVLSRYEISGYADHKLPSRIPGRGALFCQIQDINIINTHLSLNKNTQFEQMSFINDLIERERATIMVGDLNCRSSAPHLTEFSQMADLKVLTNTQHKSYPAWRPRHDLDHIISSPSLNPEAVKVHDVRFSDHRPVSVTFNPK